MKEKRQYITLIIITIAAIFIGGYNIGVESYNQDELAVLHHQDLSLKHIIWLCLTTFFHPPLYYLYLKVAIPLLGDNEFWARLSSLLFYVGSVMTPYFYRKKLSFDYWKLCLVLLLSYPLIDWARLVAHYSLSAFIINILIFELYVFTHKIEVKRWPVIALVMTVAFYTHYLAGLYAFILVGSTLLVSLLSKQLELAKKLCLSFLLAMTLASPWIFFSTSLQKMPTGENMHFWNPADDQFKQLITSLYYIFSSSHLTTLIYFTILIICLFWRRNKYPLVIHSFVMSLFVYSGMLYLRSLHYHSILVPRYFIWLVPVLMFIFLSVIPRKMNILLIALLLSSQSMSDFGIHPLSWQEINVPIGIMAYESDVTNCEVKLKLIAYNQAWFERYTKRYNSFQKCGFTHIKNSICFKGDLGSLTETNESFVAGFIPQECPAFESLLLIRPEVGRLVYFRGYRLFFKGPHSPDFTLDKIFLGQKIQ